MKKKILTLLLACSVSCSWLTFNIVLAEESSEKEMSYDELLNEYEKLKSAYDELLQKYNAEHSESKVESSVADVATGNWIFHFNKAVRLDSYESVWGLQYPDEEGKIFLAIYVEVENTGSEDDRISMYDSAGYEDGYSVDAEFFDVPLNENVFSGDVASGRKLAGCVLFEVDPDWEEFEYVYYNQYDSVKASFIITPEDISIK